MLSLLVVSDQGELQTRQTLLLKIRDLGDKASWDEFAELYTPLIYRFLTNRGLTDSNARDVMQDSLKAVASAIDRFEYDPEKGTFRSWLYTVVRSKLNNFFKKCGRQPAEAGMTEVEGMADGSDAAFNREWDLEYKRHMFQWASERVRGEFKENTWKAFYGVAVEERPAEEVAKELQMPVGGVYVAKSRVIAKTMPLVVSIPTAPAKVPQRS